MDVSGVEAFLISIQRQAEVSSSGAKPTGLMRFSLSVSTRLKITDSRSPVMMTGQIFFSPDKPRFWPVKLMNIIIFFCPMEYRITLAVDRCEALSFRF